MTDRVLAHDWIFSVSQGGDRVYAVAICRECGESRQATVGEGRLPLGGACDKTRTEPQTPRVPQHSV